MHHYKALYIYDSRKKTPFWRISAIVWAKSLKICVHVLHQECRSVILRCPYFSIAKRDIINGTCFCFQPHNLGKKSISYQSALHYEIICLRYLYYYFLLKFIESFKDCTSCTLIIGVERNHLLSVTASWTSSFTTTLGNDVYWATSYLQNVPTSHTTHDCEEKTKRERWT